MIENFLFLFLCLLEESEYLLIPKLLVNAMDVSLICTTTLQS